MDNEVKGDGNQIDYGNRIYDPRLGRFLSVDPLQKKFPALSSYQFSGNNPIATIDLDGLEPAAINPGTQNLVLILQGYGGDPPDNNTQASNAAKTIPGLGPDEALGSIVSTGPKLQIVVYASSKSDNTKNDVLSTIKNFRSVNPDGKVIVIGHSGGGDNLIELAKDNRDVQFDLLITLDTQDPKIYGIDDNNVYKNVKNAINYYQTSEAIGGETLDFKSKETKGANILSPGSNHRSIDNDQLNNVISDINNFIKGKDAVKIAKERIQPTYNPANSGSDDVFAPGDSKGGTKGTVNPKSTRDDNNKSKSSKTEKKPGG
jgi:RHS repeat-associated protein